MDLTAIIPLIQREIKTKEVTRDKQQKAIEQRVSKEQKKVEVLSNEITRLKEDYERLKQIK